MSVQAVYQDWQGAPRIELFSADVWLLQGIWGILIYFCGFFKSWFGRSPPLPPSLRPSSWVRTSGRHRGRRSGSPPETKRSDSTDLLKIIWSKRSALQLTRLILIMAFLSSSHLILFDDWLIIQVIISLYTWWQWHSRSVTTYNRFRSHATLILGYL